MKRILCVVMMLAGCECSVTSTPDAERTAETKLDVSYNRCGLCVVEGIRCVVCRGGNEVAVSCDWQHAPEAK